VSKKDLPYAAMKKPVNLLFGGSGSAISETSPQPTTMLAISQIKLPLSQPRRFFDPKKLDELSRSIAKLGVIEPLLVRPLVGDEYELVAGERRLRASKLAGLAEVPVVVRVMDDAFTAQVRLVENLQREDLNPIEETEGILDLLVLSLDLNQDETISWLHKMRNVCDRYKDENSEVRHNVMSHSQSMLVEELFGWLGKMSWLSFVKNRLPLLSLPDDLLTALRSGDIEYTKALAISKVKADVDRTKLLNDAISQDLSLSQVNQLVRSLKQDSKELQVDAEQPSLQSRYKDVSRRFQQSPVWQNPKKQKSLEKLLNQIQSLIDDEF
jgi:ParB family transcriptional regulator, chromosome partitioning protein